MAKTYDFALDKVGLDMQAYSIYADYISFLKTVYVNNLSFMGDDVVVQRWGNMPRTRE